VEALDLTSAEPAASTGKGLFAEDAAPYVPESRRIGLARLLLMMLLFGVVVALVFVIVTVGIRTLTG
jgi:hypothetical protein